MELGPWRSLVSASDWGSEGREFKSPRPDREGASQEGWPWLGRRGRPRLTTHPSRSQGPSTPRRRLSSSRGRPFGLPAWCRDLHPRKRPIRSFAGVEPECPVSDPSSAFLAPPRRLAGMAYDAARREVVVFGGANGSMSLRDTVDMGWQRLDRGVTGRMNGSKAPEVHLHGEVQAVGANASRFAGRAAAETCVTATPRQRST